MDSPAHGKTRPAHDQTKSTHGLPSAGKEQHMVSPTITNPPHDQHSPQLPERMAGKAKPMDIPAHAKPCQAQTAHSPASEQPSPAHVNPVHAEPISNPAH
jgi:hypothetical protein